MSHNELESALSDLRNPDKKIRARASDQLVQIGSSALPALLELVRDDDWVIRYRAAEALGGIQNSDTIDTLIQLTTDQKDHVRYMATKSLGKMQDPKVPSVLIRMLSDDHAYTRRIAATGLVASGDPTAHISLQKALECETDPDTLASLQASLSRLKK